MDLRGRRRPPSVEGQQLRRPVGEEAGDAVAAFEPAQKVGITGALGSDPIHAIIGPPAGAVC